MMILTMEIGGIAALCGLFLLMVGRRGRRVDDHPVCRKCGFDLFGRPAESKVCSECGADLSQRRATRMGNRRKRRGLVGMGWVILVMCAMWFGAFGWIAVKGVDVTQHKPVWLLLREASRKDSQAGDLAFKE